MTKGVVRWFSNSIGYGFIQNDNGIDVFVHYSVIRSPGYRTLYDGQVVEYESTEGPKGLLTTVVIPEPEVNAAAAA